MYAGRYKLHALVLFCNSCFVCLPSSTSKVLVGHLGQDYLPSSSKSKGELNNNIR